MLSLDFLAKLYETHQDGWNVPMRNFSLREHSFDFERFPTLMGVVNLSPDSWYRESVALGWEAALQRARVLHAQGAILIDVGAESTLAHAAEVGTALQNTRLLPVIRQLNEEKILVSAETYDPGVARACLEAGCAVINLTGNQASEEIYRAVASHDAAVIICYVQGTQVRRVADFDLQADPIPMMRDYFAREIDLATSAGVSRIFIDPGLGFYYRNLQDSSVRVRHQMVTFLNTFRLKELGWPICHALPHAFEYFREEVRSAEGFFAVLAALGGTNLFRTHEVARVRGVLETMSVF